MLSQIQEESMLLPIFHFLQKTQSVVKNLLSQKDLYYIIENAQWSIKHDGLSITSRLPQIDSALSVTSFGIRNSIIHYGSVNTFLHHRKKRRKGCFTVVTCFHIDLEWETAKRIPQYAHLVDLWHTSCILTKNDLIKIGIPEEKIILIPLGVSTKRFFPVSQEEKESLKEKMDIPKNAIVIGSFQKDGNGWGEGSNPKWIKGPDILCDALEKIAGKYKIFVLLSGPARGYVMNRLKNACIPYFHRYFDDPEDISSFYSATDLYLVTSRLEGGPKSILESLASGVPIISTRVGMAPEVIRSHENGILVDIEDTAAIVDGGSKFIEQADFRKSCIDNGLQDIGSYSWSNIAQQYWTKIYSQAL